MLDHGSARNCNPGRGSSRNAQAEWKAGGTEGRGDMSFHGTYLILILNQYVQLLAYNLNGATAAAVTGARIVSLEIYRVLDGHVALHIASPSTSKALFWALCHVADLCPTQWFVPHC